jgi:hypothetical protein
VRYERSSDGRRLTVTHLDTHGGPVARELQLTDLLGRVTKAAGISWGGNFKKPRPDPVHFYKDPGNRAAYIKDAQERYKNGSADRCKCGN